MQTEQTKTLVMNIITGVVILGVIVGIYFVFFKKDTVVSTTDQTNIVDSAEETVTIGIQISGTLRELETLNSAVAQSAEVFGSRAFRNLRDFSVEIPSEPVGRSNPFELTAWKLRLQALEAAAGKQGQSGSTTTPSPRTGAERSASSTSSGTSQGDAWGSGI